MKKNFVSLCVAVVAMVGISASAADYRSVVINKTDGSSVTVNMEYDMVTTVDAGNLMMSCPKGKISIPAEEVKGWTYSTKTGSDDVWAGIDITETNGVVMIQEFDRVVMDNLPEGSEVTLVSIDGLVISSAVVEGHHEVALDGLQRGIYVLTYNNNSIKIAVAR